MLKTGNNIGLIRRSFHVSTCDEDKDQNQNDCNGDRDDQMIQIHRNSFLDLDFCCKGTFLFVKFTVSENIRKYNTIK